MSDPLWINTGQGDSLGTGVMIATSGLCTLTGHGLTEGQPVMVNNRTGGAVAVFELNTAYYVTDPELPPDEFFLAYAPGGPIVQPASAGGFDLFAAAPAYDAGELRRAFSGLLQHGRSLQGQPNTSQPFSPRAGVLAAFRIGGSGDPFDFVSVAGGLWSTVDLVAAVSPSLTTQQATYVTAHPAESGAHDPPDGSLDRIDALDLQIQDDDEDASGFRRARYVYSAGSPSATPSPPAETPNSLRMATWLITPAGTVTVTQVAPLTVTRGGIIPVRDLDELPDANRYPGLATWDVERQTLTVDVTGLGNWRHIAGPGVFPEAVQELENTAFEFTNTGYGTTGGPVCGVAFTAPSSGRVMIFTNALIDVDTTGASQAAVTPVVRTGGTVGSGSTVMAADTDKAITIARSQVVSKPESGAKPRMGVSHLLSGLVGGDIYNVQLEHRVSSATGFLTDRSVQVVPAP